MSLTITDKQDIKVMIQEGVYRLETLNEDMSHKIDAVLEVVSVYSDVSTKVNNHELRLEDIESRQPMIIDTLAIHSKQLGIKS